jgi:hypothetical protein
MAPAATMSPMVMPCEHIVSTPARLYDMEDVGAMARWLKPVCCKAAAGTSIKS